MSAGVGLALQYLAELYVPVTDVTVHHKLCFATRGLLNFPQYNMDNYGRRPTVILVHWPSCLELTARTSVTNYFNRPFQALSENVFIRADIVFSTLETFCLMGYISLLKFTYLLTTTKPNQD